MFVYIVWFRQCSFVNKVSLVQCVICKPYLLLYILWPKKKKSPLLTKQSIYHTIYKRVLCLAKLKPFSDQ